jgi:hypothetical protein
VPTTYGNGIDSRLGAQVARDFLADQEAEANALSSGDQSLLGGHLSDSALGDVIQQMSNRSGAGTPPRVSFQPASLTVVRASDLADPSLTIEVREDGTKSVVTNNGPDQAPNEQSVNFHGDFWLRILSGAHYAIADQHIQTLPSSPLPGIALGGATLLFVGLASLLILRRRNAQLMPARLPSGQAPASSTPIDTPGPSRIELDFSEPAALPAQMRVATFGGLHIREAGRDWAQELTSRPVTGFVWLRLLVAAIRDPATPLSREEIARQATPGLSREVQLKRLRNVVAKGLRELPVPLRNRIAVEPDVMSFKLDGCEVDAIELAKLNTSAQRHELTVNVVAGLQRVVAACQGTFLPEFETIEGLATDHHPTCSELVAELRYSLVNKRVEASLLLADTYLRAGQSAPAIDLLEPATIDRPQRKDLVDRLAAAYRGAGREAEAKALEARYV